MISDQVFLICFDRYGHQLNPLTTTTFVYPEAYSVVELHNIVDALVLVLLFSILFEV